MSVNSSSNSSLQTLFDGCFASRLNTSVTMAIFISFILILFPFYILVLHVGYQRWRKQRSVSTAVMMSHSDIITFNMIFLEMSSYSGFIFYCYGIYGNSQIAVTLGMYIFSTISPGQTLFHLLTCVDRYLAVVHPITYLGLRQAGGVRIRNVTIGCVWLLCLASLGVTGLNFNFFTFYSYLITGLGAFGIFYCSMSVLCVLIRPGPGEEGGNRERVDQSKQRAFYTVMVITGALILRFSSILISSVIYSRYMFDHSNICVVGTSAAWLGLPSSLVLPLLFLHRTGKLPGWKHKPDSG